MLVLFRCDGTAMTGLGHVSRCLALAEAMSECGFTCRFLGRFEAGASDLLHSAGFPFDGNIREAGGEEDACRITQAVKDLHCAAVVVDSYLVGDAYLAKVTRGGSPVLLIDDFGKLDRYECAGVLNFTVNANKVPYPFGDQVYLLGPSYLLVRRRLRLLRRNAKPRTGPVRRVLVAIGGRDPYDLSHLAATTLLRISRELSVHVVVGHSYELATDLSSTVAGFCDESRVAVQLADLAEEFAWADMCVCGGGLTKYEAAYMGVPTAVLSQNQSQAQDTAYFARKGLALDLGLFEDSDGGVLRTYLSDLIEDDSLRRSLSKAGLAYFPEDPTRRSAEGFERIIEKRVYGNAD